MKKIAIFLPSLRGGGAERIMVTLANEFALRGYAVDLVLLEAVGPYLSEVSPKVIIRDLATPRALRSVPRMVGYLRRHRPDVVLSALSHINVVALVSRALGRCKCRLIVSERNTLSEELERMSKVKRKLLYRCMRITYRWADHITAVSHGVAEDLVATLRTALPRISVVYNPVVSPSLKKQSRMTVDHPWLQECGAGDGVSPVVLGVGRLCHQKGFDILIDSIARIRKSRPVRLIILGEGEARGELERQIMDLGVQDFVSLPGYVNNPFSYMRACSVFALSSRWEGLPGVLVQAMACGARVVAADCKSGPQEILEGGRWGTLVPVGDPQALAVALEECLDAREVPDTAQRAADFSVNSAVDVYVRLIEQFKDSAPATPARSKSNNHHQLQDE